MICKVRYVKKIDDKLIDVVPEGKFPIRLNAAYSDLSAITFQDTGERFNYLGSDLGIEIFQLDPESLDLHA